MDTADYQRMEMWNRFPGLVDVSRREPAVNLIITDHIYGRIALNEAIGKIVVLLHNKLEAARAELEKQAMARPVVYQVPVLGFNVLQQPPTCQRLQFSNGSAVVDCAIDLSGHGSTIHLRAANMLKDMEFYLRNKF